MRARDRPRRWLAAAGDAALTLLAVAGALCIALVLASWAFGLSLMLFKTGSMSPTIPAGALAVVREIPASDIAVGDVVTVERGEGELPVTHRVTAITGADPATGEVTFTMRGDANAMDDPEPYTATDVRRVLVSVPRAAHVIQWFGDPLVLGGLTLGAATLVTWAFWPRRSEEASAEEEPSAQQPDEPARLHAVGAAVLMMAVLAAPPPAHAERPAHAETALISGTHLRLQTSGDPAAMQNLAPGEPVVWTVGAWAEAEEPGRIDLALTARGALAETGGAATVTVRACAEPWNGARCPSGAQTLLATTTFDRLAEAPRDLASFPSEEQRWLQIEVALQDSASRADGLRGALVVHATGLGDDLETGPEDPDPESAGHEGPGAEDSDPNAPGDDRGAGAGAEGDGSGTAAGSDGAWEAPSAPGALARTGVTGAWALLALALLTLTGGVALRGRSAALLERVGRCR